MTIPTLPPDEPSRLETLRRYEILDTPPEPEFDDLARLASTVCGTSIALVTLVDANRQWFKSAVGLSLTETPRADGFCAHAILDSGLLVVPDARADERFAENPLVRGAPQVRFYAGAPVRGPDGSALGTLCVLDRESRGLTPEQGEALRVLSRQVASLLELRRAAAELRRTGRTVQEAEEARLTSEAFQARVVEASRDCIKVLDLEGRLLSMNAGGIEVLEICDLGSLLGTPWPDSWQGQDREAALGAVAEARRGGVGRFQGYCPTMKGRPMWWDVVVSPITNREGRPEKLLAVSRDVTERVRDERMLRELAEGTAPVTGPDFFRSLVEHLASALDVRCAFVTECMDPLPSRVRTLAFWNRDGFADNIEYDLAPTPCRRVLNGEVVCHPTDLQSLFPEDRVLVDLEVTSFLGLPLVDSSDRIIGHVAVMDDKTMDPTARTLSVLQVFAARAAAELDRVKAANRKRALLELNNAIVRELTQEGLFEASTRALRQIVPFDRAAIFLHDPERDVLRLAILESAIASDAFRVGMELPAGSRHVARALDGGRPILRRDLQVEAEDGVEVSLVEEGIRSLVVAPLLARGAPIGTLLVASAVPGHYSEADGEFLLEVAGQLALAIENMRAYEQVTALKDRLQAENIYLQEEIHARHGFEEIIGKSPALEKVLRHIEQVAPTGASVLLLGETGTGKERLARAIHDLSQRSKGPFVVVNCGAISPGLVESELFGHEKGAFTGAVARKIGRFELADGGTIFLDEVGDLPLDLQVKLLRVLQEGEIERLGGSRTIRVNARVIAATHRDLEAAVTAGSFRSDLYYRLNVFPIRVPPLRERREDIPLLVRYFVMKDGARLGKRVETVPGHTMEALTGYSWPGNIRELRNVVERSLITSAGRALELGDWVRPAVTDSAEQVRPLDEVQRDHILRALDATGWVVSGPRGAARLLGLKPTTLEARMKKLGIERPQPGPASAAPSG